MSPNCSGLRLSRILVGTRRFCNIAQGDKEGQQPRKKDSTLYRREGEWYSKLSLLAPESPRGTVIRLLQVPIDWTPGSFARWWRRNKAEAEELDQRYIPERHQILGSNLATAHFVVARGGAVRFCGQENWVQKKEGEQDYDLPRKHVPGMLLEAVDIGRMALRYEGLANFTNLQRLRRLSLAGNLHVDDWFLDRLSGMFQDTLEHLDLSNCVNVTERGLCTLYRLNALKTLNVHGLATSRTEFQLTCLMLEEIHPDLHIDGVTYLSLPDNAEN